MVEHAASGARLPLGGVDAVAPLSTLICNGCGYTHWHCGAFATLTEEPGRIRRVVNPELVCRDCDGQEHYLLALVQEWPSDQDRSGLTPLAVLNGGEFPSGNLALLVCGGCGRSEWYAWAVPPGNRSDTKHACRRCRAPQRVVERVREDKYTLPVAWPGGRARGYFELRFCDSCGLCEWYGRDLKRLRDDKGLRRVRAKPRTAPPMSGGPFR
jgi:hypothetical protein